MYSSITLEQLVKKPEGKQLEFKRDLSSSQPLLKTLVAFANSAGGQVIIGISNNGEILGVEDPLEEEERLTNLITDSIEPRLVPSVELFTLQEKTLMRVEVYCRKVLNQLVSYERPWASSIEKVLEINILTQHYKMAG